MAESMSPVLQKLVSVGTFTQPRLIVAGIAAFIASLCLAIAILSAAGIGYLLTQPAGVNRGLLPLADQMVDSATGRPIATAMQSVKWLQTNAATLTTLTICICACFAIRWPLRSLACSLITANSLRVVQRLRQHIHRKAIRLEPADLSGEQSRQTDRLFRESTQSVENASASWGKRWLLAASDLLVVVLTALCVHWQLSIEIIIPVVLGWYAIGMELHRSENSSRLLAEQAERGLQKLAEGLRKTRIVTGFAMEQQEQQQFEKNLVSYRKRCLQFHKQKSRGQLICKYVMGVLVLIPAYLLARHVLGTGGGTLTSAVVIGLCAAVVYSSLAALRPTRSLSAETRTRADEIDSYIGRVPLVGQTIGAKFFEPMSRSLTFDQVTLTTPQNPRLLHNLDLRINCGETVALLSLHPAPAYALASMIPRFVDPDAGQVLIDGQDIRQATLESLRAEAIYVGGSDPVFNASIMDNITCGHADITRQQVQEACKLVHADSFIRNMSKGYDTVIGEHGIAMDPGQTFRLSLARAIARKPAILIIEEPPVMLDGETKALLDDAYQRVSINRTVIFLPSRLSTVKKCDRLVLIHNGKIAADDTHDHLVRTNELYRHWEYMRFNNFRSESELALAGA